MKRLAVALSVAALLANQVIFSETANAKEASSGRAHTAQPSSGAKHYSVPGRQRRGGRVHVRPGPKAERPEVRAGFELAHKPANNSSFTIPKWMSPSGD